MTSKLLSESTKHTVETVRELIENRTATKEEKAGMVWKYVGGELLGALNKLQEQIKNEGNKVIECNAYNVARGANIKNPTGRLFLIPVAGTPTLVPDRTLSPGSCYFLEDERPLVGEVTDVIIVVLEKEKQ